MKNNGQQATISPEHRVAAFVMMVDPYLPDQLSQMAAALLLRNPQRAFEEPALLMAIANEVGWPEIVNAIVVPTIEPPAPLSEEEIVQQCIERVYGDLLRGPQNFVLGYSKGGRR